MAGMHLRRGLHHWALGQSALVRHCTHLPIAESQTLGQSLLDWQSGASTQAWSIQAWPGWQSGWPLQSTHAPSALLHTWLVALHCTSDWQLGAGLQALFWQSWPLPQSWLNTHATQALVTGSHTPWTQGAAALQGCKSSPQPSI